MNDRKKYVDALLLLIDNSMLIPEPLAVNIRDNVDTLPDEFIMSLGKMLAEEHFNRDVLDKKLVDTFVQAAKSQLKNQDKN